jgi:hypothetical protein
VIPLALAACAAPGPSVVSVPTRVGPSGLLIRLNWGDDPRGFGGHNADFLTDGTVIRWVNGMPAYMANRAGFWSRTP